MRTLGLVLLGASQYEHHKELNNPRFANSSREFRKLATDAEINLDRTTEVLDLYNKPLLPSDVATRVTDFIAKDFDDFIVYYCGHGDVGRREGDYRVFLRQSHRNRRHGTLLHIAGLIHDIQGMSSRKRVYFVLDACYSGSAISEMETMDAGGAEKLIDRSLSEAVEAGNGTAVFAASGRLAVAYAKHEDKLSLFTGAFIRCLREGIAHKSDLAALSWLDIKDEIVRTTRDRLGPDAPVPKLTSFSDAAIDITRVPFFKNRAFAPRKVPWDGAGWGTGKWEVDERTSEHLYWKIISEESPSPVLEDFLTRFPAGIFASPARGLLAKRIAGFNEADISRYLRDHPNSKVLKELTARLAAIKWETVQASGSVTALENFATTFSESDLAPEARRRIAVIEAEVAEAAARWECIKASSDPNDFRQFLERHPHSSNAQDACASLAGLSAAAASAASFQAETKMVAIADREKPKSWRRLVAAGLSLLVLASAGTILVNEIGPRYRLASSDTTEPVVADFSKALDAAGTDIDQLNAFIDRCKAAACSLEQAARARLANAQAAAESVRLARMQAKLKQEFDAAGNDVGKLKAFIAECAAAACAFGPEARSRLASAEAAEQMRLARVEADRRDLDAAGSDIGKLRDFLTRCRATSCGFVEAATARLASAAAAAKITPPASFNTFVNYDIDQNDIEITHDISYADCNSKCLSNADCVAFIFDKWKNACYLKRQIGPLIQDPRYNAVVRSDQPWPVLATTRVETCIYHESAMFGDVAQSFSTPSVVACKHECETNQSCVAYTFQKTAGRCTILRGVSDRTKGDPGSESGARMQNPC